MQEKFKKNTQIETLFQQMQLSYLTFFTEALRSPAKLKEAIASRYNAPNIEPLLLKKDGALDIKKLQNLNQDSEFYIKNPQDKARAETFFSNDNDKKLALPDRFILDAIHFEATSHALTEATLSFFKIYQEKNKNRKLPDVKKEWESYFSSHEAISKHYQTLNKMSPPKTTVEYFDKILSLLPLYFQQEYAEKLKQNICVSHNIKDNQIIMGVNTHNEIQYNKKMFYKLFDLKEELTPRTSKIAGMFKTIFSSSSQQKLNPKEENLTNTRENTRQKLLKGNYLAVFEKTKEQLQVNIVLQEKISYYLMENAKNPNFHKSHSATSQKELQEQLEEKLQELNKIIEVNQKTLERLMPFIQQNQPINTQEDEKITKELKKKLDLTIHPHQSKASSLSSHEDDNEPPNNKYKG